MSHMYIVTLIKFALTTSVSPFNTHHLLEHYIFVVLQKMSGLLTKLSFASLKVCFQTDMFYISQTFFSFLLPLNLPTAAGHRNFNLHPDEFKMEPGFLECTRIPLFSRDPILQSSWLFFPAAASQG